MLAAAVVIALWPGAVVGQEALFLVAEHHAGYFDYWSINLDGTIDYQDTYTFQCFADPAGIAVWAQYDEFGVVEKEVIFVTSEFSGTVEVFDVLNFAHLDCISTSGNDLAGIAMDHDNNILYAIQRQTSTLFGFDWHPGSMSLSLRPGFPLNIPGVSAAFGMAFDDHEDVLYVADCGTNLVRGFDPLTWAEVFSWQPPGGPLDVAIDEWRRIVYAGNAGFCGGTFGAFSYDLETDAEYAQSMPGNDGVMGLAVDENSGYVYLTTGFNTDDVIAYDPSTQPWTMIDSAQLSTPAGIAVADRPRFGPWIQAGVDVPDTSCAWRGDELTVATAFGNNGDLDITEATLEVALDQYLEFLSATGDYTYDVGSHTVIWDHGTVAQGDTVERFVVTEVAAATPPDTILQVTSVLTYAEQPVGEDLFSVVNVATCPAPPCVIAYLGEPVYGDSHLEIPLILEGVLDNAPIFGVDVIFNYAPAVVEATHADLAGGVLDGLGWAFIWNSPMPGEFRLGLAGTNPVPDDGVLAYLHLDVSETAPCDGCTFLDLDVLLNEGDPCVEVWPSEDWCLPMASIEGTVTYWGCGQVGNDYPPIPGVAIVATNTAHVDTAYTDSLGMYWVEACYDSCYGLTPSKPCGEMEAISALDAAMVLRHFAGLEDLDECVIEPMELQDGTWCPDADVYPQWVAAEVTGNGEIHAYDASVILKYIVGHDVSEYLVGCWTFFCESRGACVDGDVVGGQDFVGLLYGDVSGSWHMPWPLYAPDTGAELKVASVACEAGSTVEVPVTLTDAVGFYGLTFRVAHDPEVVEVLGVQPSSGASGCMFEWNVVGDEVIVALACIEGMYGSGEICRITYATEPGAPSQSPLDLRDAYADELPEPLAMVDGGIVFGATGVEGDWWMPDSYRLHGALPNPFNPVTLIRFDVPASGGDVKLEVYDVAGRYVRTLVSGCVPGGRHEVPWHGDTDGGERLSSGVYFCRFEAPGHTETKKVTLLE
jgi:hypothetical protein